MDQVKIGKFIAACRKEKGLTQASLAEKLGITDRAVSKWETGKSLPDASIMLELCELLEINVNELLTGEHITMDNYKELAESKMLELKQKEENANKRMLRIEIYLAAITIPVFLVMAVIGSYLAKGGNLGFGITLIAVGFAMVIAVGIAGMQIEHDAGYYECPNCKERYVPSLKTMYMAPHIWSMRKMKCPYCGKTGYHKKRASSEKGEK